MFKRISTLLLSTLLIFCLMGVALAATASGREDQPAESAIDAGPMDEAQEAEDVQTSGDEAEETDPEAEPETDAVPETSNFYLNGEPVQGMTYRLHSGIVYASIRSFFESVLAETEVAWANGRAEVTGTTLGGEALSLSAKPGDLYLIANERYLYVPAGITLENGVTMAPIETLLALFPGSSLIWDGETETATVRVAGDLLTGGQDHYDPQELDLVSRVISSEAGNQPLLGKIAVGNVIMNRVVSDRFPNTIYDVLYARNQFTIVHHPIFQRDPNAESVIAAKLALEGANVVPGAVYYCRAGLNCWMSRNCPYLATIADHSFYGV